ncbi:hypothetical protein BHF71_08250 [Vulcanibacillus modesticaldus]|uniref:YkoP-like domain-containing protein n=1 Tax=Vulcanibacillus modesticaldus TaxID=337097 RepID=A0A1D2YV70_9BACI|nr:hypothetical protein [Vulcanibacillus modesticaldus]OEF99604.1 hypothetical protein BHF71_08250 [Vulcanibacillus modesticaldus]
MNDGLLRFWMIYDFIYQHLTRIEYVDKENGNIFRVVFCKYRGPKLVTHDGVEINNGDPIVKLHIYNYKLTKMLKGIDNDIKLGLTALKIVKNSLPGLARYVEQHPKGENVKAIIGTTILHRGVSKLGFDVEYVPNKLRYKIKNKYLIFLLSLIHPDGRKRIKRRQEELTLKRVYISKEHLLNLYFHSKQLEEQV